MNGAEEEDKIHDDGGNLHSGDTLSHTHTTDGTFIWLVYEAHFLLVAFHCDHICLYLRLITPTGHFSEKLSGAP